METITCKIKDKDGNECGKVIEGYTIKHINYMYRQHVIAKHPDNFKVTP